MSIQDLKTKLHDVPGIESLNMTMLNGNMQFGVGGKLIQVPAHASDNEVCDAIRAAVSSDAIVLSDKIAAEVTATNAGGATSATMSTASPATNNPASTVGNGGGAASMASPSAALIPSVNVTPAQPAAVASKPSANPMSITGAASASSSLKDLIGGIRNDVQGAHAKLRANAAKVQEAAAALDGLGDDLGKEGDDLLAMVGQFKNDLGGGS